MLGASSGVAQPLRRTRTELRFRNSTVVCELPIPVREALPGTDGLESGGLQGATNELRASQVGDAQHADPTIRPRRVAEPLDRVVDVASLLRAVVPKLAVA